MADRLRLSSRLGELNQRRLLAESTPQQGAADLV